MCLQGDNITYSVGKSLRTTTTNTALSSSLASFLRCQVEEQK
jgi:hypothetical protein